MVDLHSEANEGMSALISIAIEQGYTPVPKEKSEHVVPIVGRKDTQRPEFWNALGKAMQWTKCPVSHTHSESCDKTIALAIQFSEYVLNVGWDYAVGYVYGRVIGEINLRK